MTTAKATAAPLPIGRAIQATRAARSMTQQWLAASAGITRAHLAALEAGTYEPKAETVFRLADALAVTVDELRNLAPLPQRMAGRTIPADGRTTPRGPTPCPRSKSTAPRTTRAKAGRKPARPAPRSA